MPSATSPPAEPTVHTVFEPVTATWQYVVADPATKAAVIIDPVLDFDPAKGATDPAAGVTTASADALLDLAREKGYNITALLETHAHADHLTAAKYLQEQLGKNGNPPPICIGSRITQVQDRFGEKFGIPPTDYAGAFDRLLADDEEFPLGELTVKAVHLPGHTPDHMGYIIGSNIFCGDSLFNADVGSARCDFPGGSAPALYHSVRDRLLALPGDFKIYTGHDYPPGSGSTAAAEEGKDVPRAAPLPYMTVAEQRAANKHLRDGVHEDEFVTWRRERDASLKAPRLIEWALKVNIRAGRVPESF